MSACVTGCPFRIARRKNCPDSGSSPLRPRATPAARKVGRRSSAVFLPQESVAPCVTVGFGGGKLAGKELPSNMRSGAHFGRLNVATGRRAATFRQSHPPILRPSEDWQSAGGSDPDLGLRSGYANRYDGPYRNGPREWVRSAAGDPAPLSAGPGSSLARDVRSGMNRGQRDQVPGA